MTTRAGQESLKVLASGSAIPLRVGQGALLVLGAPATPIRIGQGALLVLAREIKKRVISVSDTGLS